MTKISIYVPCIPQHFYNLDNLVHQYLTGTHLPAEIVICLCMSRSVPDRKKRNLIRKYSDHISLKLVQVQQRLFTGPNRQMAEHLCLGDIVMYQDADDLPHRKRVEYVEYLFSRYDIVSLNHSYFRLNESTFDFDKSTLRVVESDVIYKTYFPNRLLSDCREITNAYGGGIPGVAFPVHAGAVCVKRKILKETTWRSPDELEIAPSPHEKSEDFEFCMEVLYKYNKSIIVDAPIYFYRTGSAHGKPRRPLRSIWYSVKAWREKL